MSPKIEHLFYCGIVSELLIDTVLEDKEGVGVVVGVLLGHLSPVLLRPLELPQHCLAHALVHEVVGDVLLPYSGSQYHIPPLCATRTVAIDLRLRDTDTERELLSGFVPTASMSINQMRYQKEKEKRLEYSRRPEVRQRAAELAKKRVAERSIDEKEVVAHKRRQYMTKWKSALPLERKVAIKKKHATYMRNRENDPNHRPNVVWCRYRRDAKLSNREFSLEKNLFMQLIHMPCHYCYVEPSPTHGIDRYNNDLGYTKENAVPCCWMCNHAKGAAPVEEFLSWCARIAEVHRAE